MVTILPPTFQIDEVPRDKIIAMLQEEQRVRIAPETQDIYTQQYLAGNSYNTTIETEIQKYVLRTFGFSDSEESLKGYWKIARRYWEDKEVRESVFYLKNNIFQLPDLVAGDPMVDCSVHRWGAALGDNTFAVHEHHLISLRSLMTPGRPLVILAGSLT